ncbi:MAG: hypothetical protein ACI8UO_003492 [Verrucomicrobiales bacterium]|jgi:hypothetical protein
MKHELWSPAAAVWILSLMLIPFAASHAEDPKVGSSQPQLLLGAPEDVKTEDFDNLRSNSPFTRSLNLSDSLVLTGVMNFGELTTATVRDTESQEIYVVSEVANPQGWKMESVDVDPNNPSDLAKMTANILVAGGASVQVRFDERQIKPQGGRPAGGSPSSGEKKPSGEHRGPPPEVMAKLQKLNDEQRKKLGEHMARIRKENPNITREEMRGQFHKVVERITDGGKGGDRR